MKKPKVKTGLEILLQDGAKALRGGRVGLLAHAASVTSGLRYAWDALSGLPGVSLVRLFSPEHGLMGTFQDMENIPREQPQPMQGVPIFSLYGADAGSLRPRVRMLKGLDVLLADVQDIGSRYYTYLYTVAYCMESCRRAGAEVWVLDRPNPLGGVRIEGGRVAPGYRSFVGRYPLPVRHGMTVGECALMINDAFGVGCRLRVVPMEGWRRDMWYDESGLPWVMPSPNMPFLETAVVYPGACLIEGTNLSEGRGTTRPFEIVGAPWIEPAAMAASLNRIGLPGVAFRPLFFRPTFNKHAGRSCGGVQIHVMNRDTFLPHLTGIEVIRCARRLWPGEFDWRREPYEFETRRLAIDLLAGGTWLRRVVEEKVTLSECVNAWSREIREFEKVRSKYLLYS